MQPSSEAVPARSPRSAGAGSSPVSWRPLLEGELACRARQAVEDVSTALEAPAQLRDPSLAQGDAGHALLYAYLDRDRPDPGERAQRRLRSAGEAIEEVPLGPGLYGGFTGIAWALLHLRRLLPELGEDAHAEVDQALISHLERRPWRSDYDLVAGLVGFAVYALEDLSRPQARACLESSIERLAELACRRPPGVSWFTRPERLPAGQRTVSPDGYYNLGVAHGAPAVVAVLAAAWSAGVATARAGSLLGPAIDWILAQRLEPDFGSCFPPWVSERTPRGGTRLAWCYGDIGVAVVLFFASRAVRRRDWEATALEIGRIAAARSYESSGVLDGGLCHGAAGVAHLFNRLYQATGEGTFAEAALRWFRVTLDGRCPGRGVAGFRAWGSDGDGVHRWESAPGFLTGACGIALALLAAVSPVEPEWDRILLASPLGGDSGTMPGGTTRERLASAGSCYESHLCLRLGSES